MRAEGQTDIYDETNSRFSQLHYTVVFWDMALCCVLATKVPEECNICVFYKIQSYTTHG